LTVTNEDNKAVVGAGHFVTTYRSQVFDNLESRFATFKLGGDSEGQFLDLPVVKKGFWRLSTADNYAYHMGNVSEDWMKVEVSKLIQNDKKSTFEVKPIQSSSKLAYFVKSKLFAKLILNKKVMRYFLIWKEQQRKRGLGFSVVTRNFKLIEGVNFCGLGGLWVLECSTEGLVQFRKRALGFRFSACRGLGAGRSHSRSGRWCSPSLSPGRARGNLLQNGCRSGDRGVSAPFRHIESSR